MMNTFLAILNGIYQSNVKSTVRANKLQICKEKQAQILKTLSHQADENM